MNKREWLKLQAEKGARMPGVMQNSGQSKDVRQVSDKRPTSVRQFGGKIPKKMWRVRFSMSLPATQYGILESLAMKSGTTPNKVARSFIQSTLAKMYA